MAISSKNKIRPSSVEKAHAVSMYQCKRSCGDSCTKEILWRLQTVSILGSMQITFEVIEMDYVPLSLEVLFFLGGRKSVGRDIKSTLGHNTRGPCIRFLSEVSKDTVRKDNMKHSINFVTYLMNT
uniref:Uncharacterized protein n=1 Tax=Glossina pallidipes TaxID=7398 RepID=A0A1B0AHN7_GLOPL